MKKIFFALFLFIAFIPFVSFDASQRRSFRKNKKDCAHNQSNSKIVQWVRTYGGLHDDWGGRVIEKKNREGYILYYATGSFDDCGGPPYTFGCGDIWILDISLDGNINWQKTYGGPWEELLYGGMQETRDGGYIVAGFTRSFSSPIGEHDCWILKLTSNGDIEWQYVYGGENMDFPYFIQGTEDEGYIVAGTTYSFGAGEDDYWILKLTSSGQIEWQRTYGGALGERARSILSTDDGGYIISGYTYSFGAGNYDFWILKLNSSGDIEWQRTYGGALDERPSSRAFDKNSDGGYIVGGYTNSFGAGNYDFWILKITSIGDIEWQRTYGGSNDDFVTSIQETTDGGYIVGASTYPFGAYDEDGLVLKLASNGDIKWQRTYGGYSNDYVSYIQEAADRGYIAAGATTSFGEGLYDLWMLKLSPNGDIPCCGIMGISDVSVSDTSVSPSDTHVIPTSTNVIPQSTSITPQSSDAIVNLLCWNLNQPPLNISLKREINRSLFRKEAFHTVTWEPNPCNDQFVIEEYRIYRCDLTQDLQMYQLIDSIPCNAFEHVDGYLDAAKTFRYVVTSVDSDGHESPRSPPVAN